MAIRLAVLIALLVCTATAAEPRLSIRGQRAGTNAPANLWVLVRVDPHPENRWVDIDIDGDEFYRGTGFGLEGESSATLFEFVFSALPAGCYRVLVTLRATGEHGKELARIQGRRVSVRGWMIDGDPCGESI